MTTLAYSENTGHGDISLIHPQSVMLGTSPMPPPTKIQASENPCTHLNVY